MPVTPKGKTPPTDCSHCGGKNTLQTTYQFESEYGPPYVCTACLKDVDGMQYTSMPENISVAAIQGYDPPYKKEPPAPFQQRLPLP
jgi:hypothetical protein